MNNFKTQSIANGSQTVFPFSFEIPTTRKLDVYRQSGTNANEVTDLVSIAEYTIQFTTSTGAPSAGSIIFNVAPPEGNIITITPDAETDISYDFINTTHFNAGDLDNSFSETSSTNNFQISNFLSASIRYNLNENDSLLSYSNLLPILQPKAFWRREGAELISQDYDAFVEEVTEDVTGGIKDQVNASANNTNLTADIANKSFGDDYSGDVDTIDESGNVVHTAITPGKSAFSGAESARLWAEEVGPFTDAYLNSGISARDWALEAQSASGAAGGIITELYVESASPTTQVNLIDYSTNPDTPWIDVLESSFTVYVDGLKLPEPNSYAEPPTVPDQPYSVTIEPSPTLASPSFVTFNPAIPANTKILIARSEAQGDSSTMFSTGSNAKFPGSSKVAERHLSNVEPISESFKLSQLNLLWPVGALYSAVAGDPPGAGLSGVVWEQLPDDHFIGTKGTYFGTTAGVPIGTVTETDGHALTDSEMSWDSSGLADIQGASKNTPFFERSGTPWTSLAHTHELNNLKRIPVLLWKRTA